jgi:hypothetical protein
MHRHGKLRSLVLLNHQSLHRGLKRIVTVPWQYGRWRQDQLHGRVTCGAWSADDPELAMIHTEVTLH